MEYQSELGVYILLGYGAGNLPYKEEEEYSSISFASKADSHHFLKSAIKYKGIIPLTFFVFCSPWGWGKTKKKM